MWEPCPTQSQFLFGDFCFKIDGIVKKKPNPNLYRFVIHGFSSFHRFLGQTLGKRTIRITFPWTFERVKPLVGMDLQLLCWGHVLRMFLSHSLGVSLTGKCQEKVQNDDDTNIDTFPIDIKKTRTPFTKFKNPFDNLAQTYVSHVKM